MECCHFDGDPTNNALVNLRWDTHKANEADSIRLGQKCRGERIGNSKVTEATVLQIRAEYVKGKPGKRRPHGLTALAERFGLSRTNVCDIVNRRIWTHL